MDELISYLTIYALYAATLGLLFVMLFIHEPRSVLQRGVALVTGALALVVPIWLMIQSLGYPDPWPDGDKHQLLGWHVDEADKSIFVFVEQGEGRPPRQLRVPFARDHALELQKAAEHLGTYKEMSIEIATGENRSEPHYELNFVKVFDDD